MYPITHLYFIFHLLQKQRKPSDGSQQFKQLTTEIVPDINIYIMKSKCSQNSKLQCIWKLVWIRYTFLSWKYKNITCQQQKTPKQNITYEWFFNTRLSSSPLLPQYILSRNYLALVFLSHQHFPLRWSDEKPKFYMYCLSLPLSPPHSGLFHPYLPTTSSLVLGFSLDQISSHFWKWGTNLLSALGFFTAFPLA